MNIIDEIEQEYRNAKGYGIKFSIEPEAYDCKLGDRVSFGENTTEMRCGTFYNYQPILLDGVEIGFLQEAVSGKIFHPITTSFCVPLADCSEPEKITDEMRKSHHFDGDGETYLMEFATLNQMLEYLKL